MIRTFSQKPGQGMSYRSKASLRRAIQDSFAFQSTHPSSALTTDALEGLFTTLADRLGRLQDVRTDYPCDYLARCKASFTDHLIHELEARGTTARCLIA